MKRYNFWTNPYDIRIQEKESNDGEWVRYAEVASFRRELAQKLIREIGANGPKNLEDVIGDAIEVIDELRRENHALKKVIQGWKNEVAMLRYGFVD